MRIQVVVLVTAFCLFVGTANSQSLNVAKLDSLFGAIQGTNKFMGSIAVSKQGQLVYTKNIGYADVATFKGATNVTRYRIASITKTFTAVLVLKAVEEQRITLDETIFKYFPKIKNADKITIRHLLTHRSEIYNFTKKEDYKTYNVAGKNKSEMIDIISNAVSDFEPNTKASYSNSNFVLLSYILEKVYRKPYAKILRIKITKPLKLKNTFFGSTINIAQNEANSYALDTSWTKLPETSVPMFTGAGAIVSTPIDVTSFIQAVFHHKVISPASLKIMEEVKDDYGMGIGELWFEDKISYGHTGHLDGFSTLFSYFPKDDISFVILSNGSKIDNNDIALGILNIVFGQAYEIPKNF